LQSAAGCDRKRSILGTKAGIKAALFEDMRGARAKPPSDGKGKGTGVEIDTLAAAFENRLEKAPVTPKLHHNH
jgi:hypothetical protein